MYVYIYIYNMLILNIIIYIMLILNITIHIYIHTHIYPLISCYIMLYPCIISLYSCWMLASGQQRPACWAAVGEETSTTWRIRSVCAGGGVAGRRFRSQFFVNHREFIEFKLEKHGSLNVPIEHHPTIRYMVYNGYYKVMSNIPKMGQLPTPENNQQNLGFLSWENLNWKISPKLWRLQERPGKAQSPRCNSRK